MSEERREKEKSANLVCETRFDASDGTEEVEVAEVDERIPHDSMQREVFRINEAFPPSLGISVTLDVPHLPPKQSAPNDERALRTYLRRRDDPRHEDLPQIIQHGLHPHPLVDHAPQLVRSHSLRWRPSLVRKLREHRQV